MGLKRKHVLNKTEVCINWSECGEMKAFETAHFTAPCLFAGRNTDGVVGFDCNSDRHKVRQQYQRAEECTRVGTRLSRLWWEKITIDWNWS